MSADFLNPVSGLYANLADFQPRALDIRVQISAAPNPTMWLGNPTPFMGGGYHAGHVV